MSFQNPIIPGFYPDPSCIRVDDTFYLINSSFQFYPGLPIHRSTDLVNWELIGHAICRPSQLDLNYATTKVNNAERREIFTAGIYAPVIRYHGGKFYIVCTNVARRPNMPLDQNLATDNFIITATDLTNPESFSDPVYFDFYGIDPSLLFDDDGKVYMQGSFIYGYHKAPATVIRQAQINVETGEYIIEPRDIWVGAGGKVPEGPHLYKKDGKYWLLIAEGGTHRGHSITIASTDNPWGPFESYEGNPLATASGTKGEIQCIGHGELFDDKQGNWWCCMLARREFSSSYPLGRETFLAPVSWPKGQAPAIDAVAFKQIVDGTRARLVKQAVPILPSNRQVTLKSLHSIFLRTPDLGKYSEDGPRLTLEATTAELGSPEGPVTFIGQRQTSLDSEARVRVDLNTLPSKGNCGLSIYKDPYRYFSIDITTSGTISLVYQYAGQTIQRLPTSDLEGLQELRLTIRSSVDMYNVYYEGLTSTGEWTESHKLGDVPASTMSGDDFTGTIYGVYATGEGGYAVFSDFWVKEL